MYCKILASFLLIVNLVSCSDTGCEDSQRQLANTCFKPSPATNLDYVWSTKEEPEGGWYVVAANDIARLHFTENLRGEVLTLQDKFDDPCFRVKTTASLQKYEVELYGYNNLTFHWDCHFSKDFPGMFLCEQTKSQGPTEFHENFNVYHTYADNKNLIIHVFCFPNGQVGWITFSITPTLTEEERKTVSEHLKTFGFSDDNAVVTFEDSCTNK